jgi:hypothetical protein
VRQLSDASGVVEKHINPREAGMDVAGELVNGSLRRQVAQEKGRQRTRPWSRHFHVLLELSNDYRICWSRPGAAPSAEQRFEIHRSFCRHATLMEKCGKRMELENRVASGRCVPATFGRACRYDYQEGRRSRTRRRRYIFFQSPACSNACAARYIVASSQCFPTSIMPTGRPSTIPHGTFMAG